MLAALCSSPHRVWARPSYSPIWLATRSKPAAVIVDLKAVPANLVEAEAPELAIARSLVSGRVGRQGIPVPHLQALEDNGLLILLVECSSLTAAEFELFRLLPSSAWGSDYLDRRDIDSSDLTGAVRAAHGDAIGPPSSSACALCCRGYSRPCRRASPTRTCRQLT